VSSAHSASGYFTVYGDETSTEDHFDARLATGDTHTHYCRTGYVGFVRRTEMTQSDGGKRDIPLLFFLVSMQSCYVESRDWFVTDGSS